MPSTTHAVHVPPTPTPSPYFNVTKIATPPSNATDAHPIRVNDQYAEATREAIFGVGVGLLFCVILLRLAAVYRTSVMNLKIRFPMSVKIVRHLHFLSVIAIIFGMVFVNSNIRMANATECSRIIRWIMLVCGYGLWTVCTLDRIYHIMQHNNVLVRDTALVENDNPRARFKVWVCTVLLLLFFIAIESDPDAAAHTHTDMQTAYYCKMGTHGFLIRIGIAFTALVLILVFLKRYSSLHRDIQIQLAKRVWIQRWFLPAALLVADFAMLALGQPEREHATPMHIFITIAANVTIGFYLIYEIVILYVLPVSHAKDSETIQAWDQYELLDLLPSEQANMEAGDHGTTSQFTIEDEDELLDNIEDVDADGDALPVSTDDVTITTKTVETDDKYYIPQYIFSTEPTESKISVATLLATAHSRNTSPREGSDPIYADFGQRCIQIPEGHVFNYLPFGIHCASQNKKAHVELALELCALYHVIHKYKNALDNEFPKKTEPVPMQDVEITARLSKIRALTDGQLPDSDMHKAMQVAQLHELLPPDVEPRSDIVEERLVTANSALLADLHAHDFIIQKPRS